MKKSEVNQQLGHFILFVIGSFSGAAIAWSFYYDITNFIISLTQ